MKRNHRGYRVGEGHHRAKVSDSVVRQIRARYVPFVFGLNRVAREFGLPVSTVRDIVNYWTRPL